MSVRAFITAICPAAFAAGPAATQARNGVRRRFSAGLVLLAAVFSVALLAGATSATASSLTSTSTTRVVVVGAEQDVACLNPVLTTCNGFWTTSIVGIALPGAYRVAPDYSYEPMLVEHVDVATAPGFSLTYHLKVQAVWSDGVPVSADDLIFTWQTIMNPNVDVPSRSGYDQITQAVKLDAKTVRFDFSSRVAAWRSLFPTVLPQHALAGADFKTVWQAGIVDPATGAPIGAGPFLVSSYVRGQGFTLTRNPRWWGPHAPYLDEIDFKIIADTNSEIQAMLGGEVDVIAPSPQTGLSVLEGQPGIAMQANEAGLVEHLDFNVGGTSAKPLLKEQWFRQAVAYAIDRGDRHRRLRHHRPGHPAGAEPHLREPTAGVPAELRRLPARSLECRRPDAIPRLHQGRRRDLHVRRPACVVHTHDHRRQPAPRDRGHDDPGATPRRRHRGHP